MMKYKNILKSLLLLSVLSIGSITYGQKVRPDSSSSTRGYVGGPVIGPDERIKSYDNDVNSYTTVETPGFSLIASLSPHLHLNYTNPVPSNKDFYLKVNVRDGQILDNIAGGYVGDLLNNIVGGLLGGVPENYFIFHNGDNLVFEGKTHSYSGTDLSKMRLLRDGNGNSYFKFSFNQPFNRITVRTAVGGLITTPSRWIHVYDSYYYNSAPECLELLTYTQVADDLLTLLGANTGINNSFNAIDNDPNSYSSFGNQSLLNLGLGVSMEQFFQLPEPTNDKLVRIKMQMPSALLDVGVVSGVEIAFYNGNTELSSQVVDSSVVGLDLLGLINSGNNVPFSFLANPPIDEEGNILPFDKVSVRVRKPVSVGLLNVTGDLRIYDVAIVDNIPEFIEVCSKEFVNGLVRERKFDITQLIPGYNPSNAYVIVNNTQANIPFSTEQEKADNKWQPLATYYIKGITATGYCPNQYYPFTATPSKEFKITGKSSFSLPLDDDEDGTADASFTFDPSLFTTDLPNNTGVKIYDELTNLEVTGQTINFTQIGSYNYYLKTQNAVNNEDVTCDITKRLTIYVYDKDECEYRYVQRIATNVSTGSVLTGGTNNSALAGDLDMSTHGTVFNVLNLAGIGSAWIDLTFDNVATTPIAAGTPLTVKLGQEYSFLQLIGGTTIQTLDSQGNIVGPLLSVGELDLLNVLVGDNVFEFSYIPKDSNGNIIPYGGVRIISGGLLGVATSTKVYGAYIDERTPIDLAGACVDNIIINGANIPGNENATIRLNTSTRDVLYGVEDIGLGVATALSGVVYPYLAADDDIETHAYINQAASLLNAQTLTVKLKSVARPGDKVRIILGKSEVNILNLNVLGGFTVQKYLGDVPVDEPLTPADFSLIDLNLLGLLGQNNNFKFAIITSESNVPFDRVELRFTNIANVQLLGEYPKIYDVSILPNVSFENFEEGSSLCVETNLVLENLDSCTTYELSFAYPTIGSDGRVSTWNDIPNSNFIPLTNNQDDDFVFSIPWSTELIDIYNQYANDSSVGLFIKAVATRQGCQYGDIQYLRVGQVEQCTNSTIVNPMIRSRVATN